MHILIIARGIPTKQSPQWGIFEYDQAKALAKLGHKVTIASVDSRFGAYKRKIGLTCGEQDGVRFYNYFLCPSAITGLFGQTFQNKIKKWQWQQLVKAICQKEDKIDVIYSHYLFNSYYAVTFLRHLNIPIVAIEHWSEINKPKLLPSIQKKGEEVYPKVDQLLTVSKAAQSALKRHFNQDSIVVYNMVNSDIFKYLNCEHTSNKIKFIATGSLIHRKGYDLLIDAFAKLQLPASKWELNIIGTGIEHDNLAKRISDANLTENIHLLGSRTANEIATILNQADVFVLPSRMETFGVVYIEALACGLPVIATPCGGPEEFITKQNGLLVPTEDVEALSEAIKQMFYHHQEYNRKAIANDCKARFSSEVIAKQLTDIFEDVIRKKINRKELKTVRNSSQPLSSHNN